MIRDGQTLPGPAPTLAPHRTETVPKTRKTATTGQL
jgi:hypothetical protein